MLDTVSVVKPGQTVVINTTQQTAVVHAARLEGETPVYELVYFDSSGDQRIVIARGTEFSEPVS